MTTFLTDIHRSRGIVEIDFSTDVLPHFMGRINTFHNDVHHRNVGTPENPAVARMEYPALAAGQAAWR